MAKPPTPSTATDEEVRVILACYRCPVPFHVAPTRDFGNIASPGLRYRPSGWLELSGTGCRAIRSIRHHSASGVEAVRRLQVDGITTRSGRPLDKADVYKLLHNRTYVGDAAQKGNIYPGEQQGIVPRDLWDRVHAILRESPRVRANQNRTPSPALLRGLIFGVDGRAMSPSHTVRQGRQYR